MFSVLTLTVIHFYFICSHQHGDVLSSLLTFKKEIAGGFHPVSAVVGLAPRKKVVTSVQSAAAQRVTSGMNVYASLTPFLRFQISRTYQHFMIMVLGNLRCWCLGIA
jgi:hypothetical protein